MTGSSYMLIHADRRVLNPAIFSQFNFFHSTHASSSFIQLSVTSVFNPAATLIDLSCTIGSQLHDEGSQAETLCVLIVLA